VVALFGGNRLQFGLADHVTGRIHVRIRRLEVLVDKNSPVVVRLHSNCLKADILAVGLDASCDEQRISRDRALVAVDKRLDAHV